MSGFGRKEGTDHGPLATASCGAGLQPDHVLAPRRKTLHHKEPQGGTGVQNERSVQPEAIAEQRPERKRYDRVVPDRAKKVNAMFSACSRRTEYKCVYMRFSLIFAVSAVTPAVTLSPNKAS
ncbi:hypothetical protein EYF80_022605 [Liparis tanakae]|uniref:Uncharacterized protein n=1 Tax=Liparis tanakae TaxID=230148 RepID=A0A4Z2HMW3_9TELE|nr:hypothetical protein EYF80_022605 [Liparis tanakae]